MLTSFRVEWLRNLFLTHMHLSFVSSLPLTKQGNECLYILKQKQTHTLNISIYKHLYLC